MDFLYFIGWFEAALKNLRTAEHYFLALHGKTVNESPQITSILVNSIMKKLTKPLVEEIYRKFASTRLRIRIKYLNNKLAQNKQDERSRRQIAHLTN